MVQSQLQQIVHETLSWKNPSQKRAGGVAQGVGPEFKLQYRKKRMKIIRQPSNLGNQKNSSRIKKKKQNTDITSRNYQRKTAMQKNTIMNRFCKV
jgi:hypothetical protein